MIRPLPASDPGHTGAPLWADRRLVPIVIVGALLIVAGLGLWVWTLADTLADRDAAVRSACDQYAAPLDLSGMAQLCADVGYQQTFTFTPNGIAPEDLERPTS